MRTTLRMLARRPGFSVLATLTLALGIAATTVVFTFAYGVLLSPLPYSNTSRLMLLWEFDRTARSDPGSAMGPVTTVPPQDLLAWQQQTRTMESLDALTFGFFSITQGASPTEVIGGRVTPGFFRTIGVQPLIGRAFAPGDPDDVVVLGYDLWQTQYGGDRAIVGRQILLGDGRYTVLGVLPPQFFFYMREFALWTPLSLRPGGRRPRPVMGVGLLRPGVTEPEAQAEFDAIASRLESQSPATNRNRGARVTSVREQYSRFYRPMLGVLLASVGFLLLIACANVASLLLARATERDREMAIRAALGATRWQMVRQLLAESLALAVFAGVTGVAAALFLVPLARTLLPMKLPIPLPGVDRIAISTPVLLFSSAVSVVTVLLFGLAPALRSATAALGARSTTPGVTQRRFLDAVVVAELALAVLLLTGAGLGMRSVYSLYHGTGFRVDHILTFRTPTAGLPPQRLVRFYQDVIGGLRILPGVRAAAAAYGLPGGGSNGRSALFAEGGSTDPKDAEQTVVNQVSGEFFRALDIPILAGRSFSEQDTADAPQVAILSAGLARKLFGSGNAIGRRVRIGGQAPDQWLRVAGIAGDVRPMLSAGSSADHVSPVYAGRARRYGIRDPLRGAAARSGASRGENGLADPAGSAHYLCRVAGGRSGPAGLSRAPERHRTDVVCRFRPGAGGDRDLRADRLRSEAEAARVRRAGGAGCHLGRRGGAGAPPRRGPDRRRPAARSGRVAGAHARAQERVVWCAAHRPADVCGCGRTAGGDRHGRVLSAGEKGRRSRPDDGAAQRVTIPRASPGGARRGSGALP